MEDPPQRHLLSANAALRPLAKKVKSMVKSNEIPLEILLNIAKFLERNEILSLSLVCREWYPVLEANWSHHTLVNRKTKNSKLSPLPNRKWIKYLRIIGSNQIKHLASLITGCSSLVQLILQHPTKLSNDDLWIISSKCCNLNRLVLTSNQPAYFDDEGLIAVARLENLQHLVLCLLNPFTFTERGILALANGFKGKLHSFSLLFTPGEVGVGGLSGIIGGGGGLSVGSHASDDAPSPTHNDRFIDALCVLIQSHPYLENIAFDWPCFSISKCLEAMAAERGNHRLKHLSLKNIQARGGSLGDIIQKHTQLEKIILSHMVLSDEELTCFSNPLNQLTTLSIDNCFAFGKVDFTLFTNLTVLEFSPRTDFASLYSVPSESCIAIATHCPQLIRLKFPIFNNEGLVAFSRFCPHLKHLDILDGRAIDTSGFLFFISLSLISRSCYSSHQF